MECPKCKSNEFVIYDYQPLHTVEGMRIEIYESGERNYNENDRYLDNELYAELKCTTCGKVVKAKADINFKLI
jgi:phage FluMu protein Com